MILSPQCKLTWERREPSGGKRTHNLPSLPGTNQAFLFAFVICLIRLVLEAGAWSYITILLITMSSILNGLICFMVQKIVHHKKLVYSVICISFFFNPLIFF